MPILLLLFMSLTSITTLQWFPYYLNHNEGATVDISQLPNSNKISLKPDTYRESMSLFDR